MRTLGLISLFALSACAATLPVDPPQAKQNICGGMMGMICGSHHEFCRTEISAQCGAADQTGVCTIKPQVCTMDYNPVCGCDGQTYSNECVANSKGVSAAYAGQCTN